MVANVGRAVTFLWGDASPQEEILGVREKGIKLNGEPVDVTSDDSDGWRELLTVAAENQVDVSLQGVTKDATLRAAWFGDRTAAVTLTYPDAGGTITGTFYLASYNETATYNDAIAFEAELQSSGVVTYTPGA